MDAAHINMANLFLSPALMEEMTAVTLSTFRSINIGMEKAGDAKIMVQKIRRPGYPSHKWQPVFWFYVDIGWEEYVQHAGCPGPD